MNFMVNGNTYHIPLLGRTQCVQCISHHCRLARVETAGNPPSRHRSFWEICWNWVTSPFPDTTGGQNGCQAFSRPLHHHRTPRPSCRQCRLKKRVLYQPEPFVPQSAGGPLFHSPQRSASLHYLFQGPGEPVWIG
jgi:hypothetical protein